eukprot:XP_028343216.1 uncharacterized protein LOC114485624 [Physeter catodon]
MWKTRFAFLPVTSFCSILVLIFLMKGSSSHAQVPPFSFGRTDGTRSSPFPDAHPLSEEGVLSSETSETRLWQSSDNNCDTEGATSSDKADEGSEETRHHEGRTEVDGSRHEEGQGTPHTENDLPKADEERFEDLYEGAATAVPSTSGYLRRENVCRHTSITLRVDSPGEKVIFRCGNSGADLRPGALEVFPGSTCSGPPVLLCAVVPGATLLNKMQAEGQGWTLSVGKLPSAATTLCYECRVISDEGVTSVCSVIVNVAAADPTAGMHAATAGEQSALGNRALLKGVALVTVALTLAL